MRDAPIPGLALHLIGLLQTNKVCDAVALCDAIETVERPRLAQGLAREMEHSRRRPPYLIEVNTGEEPQKSRVLPTAADDFIVECRDRLGLPSAGLMCFPPLDEEPALHFALLGEIARRTGLGFLSMGMSADFREGDPCQACARRHGDLLLPRRGPQRGAGEKSSRRGVSRLWGRFGAVLDGTRHTGTKIESYRECQYGNRREVTGTVAANAQRLAGHFPVISRLRCLSGYFECKKFPVLRYQNCRRGSRKCLIEQTLSVMRRIDFEPGFVFFREFSRLNREFDARGFRANGRCGSPWCAGSARCGRLTGRRAAPARRRGSRSARGPPPCPDCWS